jgi:hypothetical protein
MVNLRKLTIILLITFVACQTTSMHVQDTETSYHDHVACDKRLDTNAGTSRASNNSWPSGIKRLTEWHCGIDYNCTPDMGQFKSLAISYIIVVTPHSYTTVNSAGIP